MKAGILTFNRSRNYGAMLQAYALQTYLRDNGVDALHIAVRGTQDTGIKTLKDLARRVVKHKSYRAYQKFSDKLDFYPGEYDEQNADQLNDAFDMFISGSDQVWNITNGMDPMFYQTFVRNKIKASYAASMGIGEIPEKWVAPIQKALETFDHISVRENTAKEMLGTILEKPISCVVDPVFLLKKEQWDELCGPRIEKVPYIFVYGTQMRPELKAVVKLLAECKKLKILSVFPMEGAKALDALTGPAEFVNYVKYADYVITTSFHCTAFSLIYEKPLIEVLHTATGSRVADLLEMVGMEESCIWNDSCNINEMRWDYSQAGQHLAAAIEESKAYISSLFG